MMTLSERLKWIMVAGGSVVAVAAPALAGSTIEMRYAVEVAGAQVMKVSYSAAIAGSNFESELVAKTSGMSNVFSGYRMNWSAAGRYADGTFSPQSYENTRKKKSKKAKSTGITWESGGVAQATGAALPSAVSAALNGTSSDPLTAVLKIASSQGKKPCSGKFRVFDGRDVFDLSLSLKKKITLASAAGVPGLECSLTSTPVAGRAVDDGETKPDAYGLTLAPIKSDGLTLYIPVRITGKSKGLSVTVTASSITIDGADVSAASQ
jgi:Protein of unknown function (DUF3108)